MRLIFLLSALLVNISAYADTQVLPKGVNSLIYRNMQIGSSTYYDPSSSRFFHGASGKLDFQQLLQNMPAIKEAEKALNSIDKSLVEDLNLIAWDIQAEVEANVHALAYAHGLTDSTTIGIIIPMVEAKTTLKGGFEEKNAIVELNQKLNRMQKIKSGKTNEIRAAQQILAQLENLQSKHIQGYLVNDLGYEPIGNWSGEALSDVTVFLKTNFYASPKMAMSLEYGLDLPTAYVDDPNIMTDFSFGHGTWAPYLSFAQDYFLHRNFTLFSEARGQYFVPQKHDFRYADVDDVIAEDLDEFKISRGARYMIDVGASLKMGTYFSFNQSIAYQYNASTKLDSRIIDFNSEPYSYYKNYSKLTFSTIDSYLAKKAAMPMQVSLAYEDIIYAKNSEDIATYYLEARLFF